MEHFHRSFVLIGILFILMGCHSMLRIDAEAVVHATAPLPPYHAALEDDVPDATEEMVEEMTETRADAEVPAGAQSSSEGKPFSLDARKRSRISKLQWRRSNGGAHMATLGWRRNRKKITELTDITTLKNATTEESEPATAAASAADASGDDGYPVEGTGTVSVANHPDDR